MPRRRSNRASKCNRAAERGHRIHLSRSWYSPAALLPCPGRGAGSPSRQKISGSITSVRVATVPCSAQLIHEFLCLSASVRRAPVQPATRILNIRRRTKGAAYRRRTSSVRSRRIGRSARVAIEVSRIHGGIRLKDRIRYVQSDDPVNRRSPKLILRALSLEWQR